MRAIVEGYLPYDTSIREFNGFVNINDNEKITIVYVIMANMQRGNAK